MNVLYLVKQFPSLSQTFVAGELRELARRGGGAWVMAALDPADGGEAGDDLAARTAYLEHDYAYAYAARGRYDDDAIERRAAEALDSEDRLVTRGERARLRDEAAGYEGEGPRARRAFLEALAVVRFARAREVQHLHCDFAEDNVRLAYLVHRAVGMPFTFKMRAYDVFAEPQADLRLWATAAERVLTISEYNRRHLVETLGLPEEKVVVVRDGIRLDAISPVSEYRHRPFRIASAGRLVEKKGLAVLLDACARLAARGVPFEAAVYGDGPEREALAAQAARLGLEGRLTLAGSRPQAELLEQLRAASVFVLPCVRARNGDRDGTPNVLMEAMALALPVVSTRLSGIPELVADGEDGLLVEPGDAGALADAIERLHADRVLGEGLRLRARRTAEARFGIERTVDGFLAAAAVPVHAR
jgi:glycosyltransferase involved in cell wall biosynthesis